ncbi:hypothetical protein [Chryseobacterium herbae]|uniref:Uncharacterized protein n=1 Tax=Chryseobacterium herbae TaxID=2976476 RepID=A0ABT2IXG8_9FLAO|nr:hypothetical protein [Chryseobacterium sp. pc1-10]MCT2563300.1 hypothetical protein [Chryseobacterium sp. pc1-10]
MKNKLIFFSLAMSLGLLGQTVKVVSSTENYDSNGIVYNNSLFFSKNNKLAQFNGVSVVNLPNPNDNGQPIDGKLTGSMIIYNNKLCYNYDYTYLFSTAPTQYRTKDYIITYDGSTQTAFWNSDAGSDGGIFIHDNGGEAGPVLYNGKLIFKGSYYGGSNLFTFDGQVVKKIPNQYNISSSSNRIKLGDWALVYNNILYFSYVGDGNWDGIGKFDGTSITKITNNNQEYWGGIFALNNTLYFKMYFMSNPAAYSMGTYDPAVNDVSMISSPNMFLSGGGKPLMYNSKAYMTSGGGKFAIFDGLTTTEIPNLNMNDKGVAGSRVLFGNNIYFPYQDSNMKYFLGQYSGTSISLIPNASTSDQGIGKSLIEFNGELYFTYTTTISPTPKTFLAKYDGQNITVLPNPDSGQGVQDSKFVVYGNDLYFPYKNAAGIINMAKYGTTVLSTKETVKDVGVSIFKDNNGFSVVSKTEKITKIEVLDASGRAILNTKANAQKYSFDIGVHGVFIVNVTLDNGKVSTLKVRN